MISEEHALACVKAVLSEKKAEVVQTWAAEKFQQQRELLWVEYQAIERIEESLSADFGNIIRRAAGE